MSIAKRVLVAEWAMHDDSVQIALQKFELNSKSENLIYDVVFYL